MAIYNPSAADNVNLDISAIGLTSGDSYRVSSIQNPLVDRITNTYSAPTVSFPITNHTMSDLLASYASNRPPVFYPELGGFLIEYLGAGAGRTNFSVFGGEASFGVHWRGCRMTTERARGIMRTVKDAARLVGVCIVVFGLVVKSGTMDAHDKRLSKLEDAGSEAARMHIGLDDVRDIDIQARLTKLEAIIHEMKVEHAEFVGDVKEIKAMLKTHVKGDRR